MRLQGLFILGFVLFSLLLSGVAYFTARNTLEASLDESLSKSVPVRINEALVNGDDRPSLMAHLRQRLAGPLAHLTMTGGLFGHALGHCRAQVETIGALAESEAPAPAIDIRWQHEGRWLHAGLALDCEPRWGAVLLQGFVPGAVVFVLLWALPAPASRRQRDWYERIKSNGIRHREAKQLTAPLGETVLPAQLTLLEHLIEHFDRPFAELRDLALDERAASMDDRQRAWFIRSLQLFDFDISRAWAIATAQDILAFDLSAGEVRVRGVAVSLPPTPLLYYFWYARRRVEGDGWFANPPSNRPDMTEGRKLGMLMAAHQGHTKAINDLRQNGLRSKSLDQNRNRIKEELVAVLGEQLAEPYLFVSERSQAHVQSRYRLSLSPQQIVLGAPAGAKGDPAEAM
ncbi:hypothetical protein [Marinobacter fonticola]|uniref:hypothetical protein n=1 Tax=Marinobacter fonticola TaxID=2603215 RepID=UPI0011E76764|nr:hypothetical protein [Marinobacter fonticola]